MRWPAIRCGPTPLAGCATIDLARIPGLLSAARHPRYAPVRYAPVSSGRSATKGWARCAHVPGGDPSSRPPPCCWPLGRVPRWRDRRANHGRAPAAPDGQRVLADRSVEHAAVRQRAAGPELGGDRGQHHAGRAGHERCLGPEHRDLLHTRLLRQPQYPGADLDLLRLPEHAPARACDRALAERRAHPPKPVRVEGNRRDHHDLSAVHRHVLGTCGHTSSPRSPSTSYRPCRSTTESPPAPGMPGLHSHRRRGSGCRPDRPRARFQRVRPQHHQLQQATRIFPATCQLYWNVQAIAPDVPAGTSGAIA